MKIISVSFCLCTLSFSDTYERYLASSLLFRSTAFGAVLSGSLGYVRTVLTLRPS